MDRKGLILNFRWLTLLLSAGLLELSGGGLLTDGVVVAALTLMLFSNLGLHLMPTPLFRYRPHWFGLTLADVLLVSAVVQRLGVLQGEAFFLYLPVIGLSACIHGQRGLAGTVAAVAAVYGGMAWGSGVVMASEASRGLLFRTAMLAVMGAAFGLMALRVRLQVVGQQLAEARRRDLEAVVRAAHRLATAGTQSELLSLLVRSTAELVTAYRCSVVVLQEAGEASILVSREMLALEEHAATHTLRIHTSDYPELTTAVAARSLLRIPDVQRHRVTRGVRGKLADLGIRSLLVAPLAVDDPVLGTLVLSLAKRRGPFTERDGNVVDLIANVAGTALKNTYIRETLEAERHSLHRMAITDSLTGLYNRRFFDMRLEEESRLAVRHGLPLSLVLLDVDHFKRVNDTHGHGVGDRVLAELARVIGANLRQTDCFARYGGEEFVILMPLTDPEGAVAKAEEIRLAVKEATHRVDDGMMRVTVSFGVSGFEPGQTASPVDLLSLADRAVYAAKRGGRDRVCRADPPSAPALSSQAQTSQSQLDQSRPDPPQTGQSRSADPPSSRVSG
ncbi:MAG: sensor domain-containing diguanylate cyclase [Nitrospirota bacterium]|nr:sensor domain-containing diguanylate cyclase [Nitrospirota bacterium]